MKPSTPDRQLAWVFILPSLLLFSLFASPFFALFGRSVDSDFFTNAFSAQAIKALRLSLMSSTLTTAVTILLGTPFAYILARWRFRTKAWL
jgi:molybdate transport system permease protein